MTDTTDTTAAGTTETVPRRAAVVVLGGQPHGRVDLSELREGDRFTMLPGTGAWRVTGLSSPDEAPDLLSVAIAERQVPLVLPPSVQVHFTHAPRVLLSGCRLCGHAVAVGVDIATQRLVGKPICEACDNRITDEVRAEVAANRAEPAGPAS